MARIIALDGPSLFYLSQSPQGRTHCMKLNAIILTASLSLFVLGFFISPSASKVNQATCSTQVN
jgi:hypothetical protein